ncbi:MAG: TonB-dependent receptor [Azoarcus sp.]|nr:TonB-dependent receptor [Azoarcus sp.]
MQSRILVAAVACALACPTLAAEETGGTPLADEVAALREQIAQMKAAYEGRIAALEEKLDAERRTGNERNAPARTAAQAATSASPSAPQAVDRVAARSGASAFNPEISLILQGAYKGRKDVAERHIGGFVGAEHHHGDGVEGDNKRGFTLDHSELVLAANIDPNFRGQATLALLDDEVELEEAWFQTTALGHGLGLKAGRFLSGIGYLNEQHAHQWDFYEQPLMYKALFGEHGYTQDGVQAKWVAPLSTFVELGAEAGRGNRFPGDERNLDGFNSLALFAHTGGDIGASNSWRAGISWLQTRADARESHFESEILGETHGAFSGRSRMWIADFVYKWSPDGNPARRNFKVQAEYFHRKESGHLAVEDGGGNSLESPWRTRQHGYYIAGVYQFTPNWRAGLRYDRLSSGRQSLGANPAEIEIVSWQPRRFSVMADYSWSEFSRLRLQWSRDRAMPGITDNQVTLQYVMSLGSHGAHKF